MEWNVRWVRLGGGTGDSVVCAYNNDHLTDLEPLSLSIVDMVISLPVGDGFAKEVFIVSGLVAVQLIYAIYMVFLTYVLTLGMNTLFLVIFGSLATAIFLIPFAVVLERKKWPARLRPTLIAQFVLMGLGGVTAFQGLMLLGIKMTSPAIASAMPNLAPGLIFIIAACFRYEKFDIRCNYTRAKVLGTLVCLTGAIAMSFLQSPPSSTALSPQDDSVDRNSHENWIIGCFYLLSAVVVLSCNTVLQAAVMIEFPAPFTVCVITSLVGATLTALLQIITEGKLDVGSTALSMTSVISIVLVGGSVSSVCVSFQTWCVNQKGPVLVSIFNPVQTIFSAVLSAVFLKQIMGVASLGGMFLMFIGLYIVLWAKKKESCGLVDSGKNATLQNHDIEKSLLS